MSSRFSPITGIREEPLRRARDIAWRKVLVRSMNTTSVRGTMVADQRVAELEDRVDHLPLAGLDDAARLGQVDQLAQLGLGGERALAEAASGGQRVSQQDQQP